MSKPDQQPAQSRVFFWWYMGILIVPVAGIAFLPDIAKIWVLVVFADTAGFFYYLGRYMGRGLRTDAASNRALCFMIAAMFAAMTLVWGGRLGYSIIQSGSLNL